jgi:1-deoxy-D-xylulose-5-phosphate reductoisomerase
MPAVLNAANEQAWRYFWKKKSNFWIFRVVLNMYAIASSDNRPNPSLDDIVAADEWARQEVLAARDKIDAIAFSSLAKINSSLI